MAALLLASSMRREMVQGLVHGMHVHRTAPFGCGTLFTKRTGRAVCSEVSAAGTISLGFELGRTTLRTAHLVLFEILAQLCRDQ